jgi:aminoglycoside phosphotransferase (APT) family kinase protein
VDRVLARHLPERRDLPVVPLGAGEDNAAFAVGSALVVRCSTHPDRGERSARVLREARLLRAVAEVSSLPVPVPLFVAADDGCLGYLRLPGRPLLDLAPADLARQATVVGAALGGLIAALAGLPAGQMAEVTQVDRTPPEEWLTEAQDLFPRLAEAIPDRHLPAVQAFLDADPPRPAEQLVLCHNDLGIEHVLVDAGGSRITGVIDWTDAGVADPARDLGLILRDLGPGALDAALTALGSVVSVGRDRIRFFARCALLEDLAHGLDTGRSAYAHKSRRGMAWLFPVAHAGT